MSSQTEILFIGAAGTRTDSCEKISQIVEKGWRAWLGDISRFEPTKSGADKQYARNPQYVQSPKGSAGQWEI